MGAKSAQQQGERPADWQTVEEPLRLRETIVEVESTICLVVDCLTLWTANALAAFGAADAEAQAAAAAAAASARSGLTVAVTNEVGLGIVPDNPLGRGYRDLLGRVNTIWAEAADQAYLLVAGRALVLGRTASLVEGFQ